MTVSPGLRVLTFALAGLTFALVVLGAAVNSHDAGLSVPDWPTTFGEGMFDYPLAAMTGGVEYEHTHRLLASLVGLVTAVWAVWTGLAVRRRDLRTLAAVGLGAVLVQGLLGGATVLWGLPPAVSIAHGVLGQAFLGLVVAYAVLAAPPPSSAPAAAGGGLAAAAALGVVVQLLLGAILRHTAEGLTAHVCGAVAVAALGLAAWIRAESAGPPASRAPARLFAGLLVLQAAVGVEVWRVGPRPLLATLHVGTGAALLAAGVVLALRAAPSPRRIADFATLARHRMALLIVAAALAGFLLGSGEPARGPAVRAAALLHALLGTALLAAGASALNQWLERDRDARMTRTADRPLPSGRVEPGEALRFGAATVVAGAATLAVGANLLAAALGLLTAALYLGVYTPLKRTTSLNTIVGAVPGALPVLLGYAAARGRLETEAWALFQILFLWQVPHFLAIATVHRDDYARGGFAMLPVGDAGGAATRRQTLLFLLALVPASLLPTIAGLAGPRYAAAGLGLGLGFLLVGLASAGGPPRAARRLVRASILYLPLLLTALVWDRA